MKDRKKNSINEKLDVILKNQEKILKNERKILGEEEKLEKLEEEEIIKEDLNQKTEEDALKELEKLESQIKKSVTNPMKKITKRDFFKGLIGAFVGVVGHFAFSKAADIALTLTVWNATVLYVVAFLIILIMLYYTGFRNIEKHIILKFMPVRALVLFFVSILTVLIVNLLFGKIHFPITFSEIYVLVGASIILATMGAGTADLIGRNE